MTVLKHVCWIFISGVLLLSVGCSFDFHDPSADEYDVQIIGDSIFDLSGDIQEELADLSGKVYKDRSVSGEKIDGIMDQYDRAIYNTPSLKTVIADGGGNDILQGSADCDSDPLKQECIDVIDYVADSMEILLEDMYNDGVDDCVWLGYYYLTRDEAEKNEALDYAYTLYPAVFSDASLNLYGSGGAYMIDPRGDIEYSQVKSDGIHPTASGSEELAGLIWDEMVAQDTYR
jgi:hypothetical protein